MHVTVSSKTEQPHLPHAAAVPKTGAPHFEHVVTSHLIHDAASRAGRVAPERFQFWMKSYSIPPRLCEQAMSRRANVLVTQPKGREIRARLPKRLRELVIGTCIDIVTTHSKERPDHRHRADNAHSPSGGADHRFLRESNPASAAPDRLSCRVEAILRCADESILSSNKPT
jgi:hypothetical protein